MAQANRHINNSTTDNRPRVHLRSGANHHQATQARHHNNSQTQTSPTTRKNVWHRSRSPSPRPPRHLRQRSSSPQPPQHNCEHSTHHKQTALQPWRLRNRCRRQQAAHAALSASSRPYDSPSWWLRSLPSRRDRQAQAQVHRRIDPRTHQRGQRECCACCASHCTTTTSLCGHEEA